MVKLNDFLFRLWIYFLTISAGMVNTGALLQYSYVSTHHTGSLTQLGIQMANGQGALVGMYFGLLVAYVGGATLSGHLFPREYSRPLRRYAGLIASLSGCLLVLLWANIPSNFLLLYISFMAGAQNGMILFYRGIVIRTTHVTGSLTDLGLALGRWMKEGHEQDRFRFRFQFKQLLMFFLGCFIMTLANRWVHFNLLYLVVGFNSLAIIIYGLLYRSHGRLFSIEA